MDSSYNHLEYLTNKFNSEKDLTLPTHIYLREPLFFKDNFKKMKMPTVLLYPFIKTYTQTNTLYSSFSFFDDYPIKPFEMPSETLTNNLTLSWVQNGEDSYEN